MPTINNNKPVDMKQLWQQCEPLPTAAISSALASTCTAADGSNRFIYYSVGALFYKYDCYGNAWFKGQSPNITPTVRSSMSYSKREGHRGNCLGATTNTIKTGFVPNVSLNGYTLRITAGTGDGQERTVLTTGDAEVLDSGMVTAATALVLTDTTKRWEINQFVGCSVRLVYGTGLSQTRKILFNDATNLYVSDTNYQQLEPWHNTPFSIVAPFAAPVATAGLQANYQIEQRTLTLSSNWTTVPDTTSSFVIESGGIWLFSSAAASPFSSLQFYDVLTDTWATKTPLGGLLTALIGTDFSITHIEENVSLSSGSLTDGTARTVTLTTPLTGADIYSGFKLRVTNPATGVVQRRRIVGHTASIIQVELPFDTTPTSSYTYEIYPDADTLYLVGNGASSMYQYHVEKDIWTTGSSIDTGQCRNASFQFGGQEAYAISTGVRNATGITVLNSVPTAKGSGYAVGDLFNITTGGTVGKGRVESISAGGVVETVSLYAAGINYTTGTGKATTKISGAGNDALTVNITSVGNVGRITSTVNVNLYKGDAITITGSTAWDGAYTVLAIDSLTTFDVLLTPTANLVVSSSNSTTVVVDSTKNYAVNELAGKLLILQTAGVVPTTQIRRITSNTATTITVPTITQGVNGTSRYVICEPQAFGRDRQWKLANKMGVGYATGGSTTTLIDTTKNWFVNQWAGYKFKILSGTGFDMGEITVTSNTATTLTYATQTFSPDTTTKYLLMDTFGAATGTFSATTFADSTKNWTVNQWAGKKVIITSGTGARVEATIASNTANVLTVSTITVPDATTTYTILGMPSLSTGIELMHLFNTTVGKSRYLFVFRGGASNIAHKYDIGSEFWDFTYFIAPQTETLTTGSEYAYDGGDRIYFSPGVATGIVQYVFYLNLTDGIVYGLGSVPNTQLAPAIGNRMEIVDAPSNIAYLYHIRNSGCEMYRCQIFF